MKKLTNEVKVGDDLYEFNVEPENLIIIRRHFDRYTERDKEIRNLLLPVKPLWLRLIVLLIRFYQNHISRKLGNRCVFDPSCSHYSELSFRKYGFLKGCKLTISRLRRCKPATGGIDELT